MAHQEDQGDLECPHHHQAQEDQEGQGDQGCLCQDQDWKTHQNLALLLLQTDQMAHQENQDQGDLEMVHQQCQGLELLPSHLVRLTLHQGDQENQGDQEMEHQGDQGQGDQENQGTVQWSRLRSIRVSHPFIPTGTCLLLKTIPADYSLHMYGGDIALTPEQQATLEATSNQISPFALQHAVVRSEQFLWEDGKVYYIFDYSLSKENRPLLSVHFKPASCKHSSLPSPFLHR